MHRGYHGKGATMIFVSLLLTMMQGFPMLQPCGIFCPISGSLLLCLEGKQQNLHQGLSTPGNRLSRLRCIIRYQSGENCRRSWDGVYRRVKLQHPGKRDEFSEITAVYWENIRWSLPYHARNKNLWRSSDRSPSHCYWNWRWPDCFSLCETLPWYFLLSIEIQMRHFVSDRLRSLWEKT